MKLSEINPSENLKVLLSGAPGSGKTCTALGFPYPILVLAFEPKVSSAAAWYAGDKERLENVDVRPLWQNLDSGDPVEDLMNIISKELIPQQKAGVMKYKTLVIDSMSTFSNALLLHIVKTNGGIKRPVSKQGMQPCQMDYGILKREFHKLIPGILSLPMNVVMLAHIKTDRSELTGEILRIPYLDGSYGEKLAEVFDESYFIFMKDGKPFARSKSDQDYKFCRSQIPGLPEVFEISYANLTKKWK